MRLTILHSIITLLPTFAIAQLIVLPINRHPAVPDIPASDDSIKQHPIMPDTTTTQSSGPAFGPGEGSVMLSDVMGRDRSINMFASFCREVSSIATRLDASSQNSTVLAPLNSAVEALPRKPWENPEDYDKYGTQAYDGSGGQKRAQDNMKKFVEMHIVPVSPWKEGEKVVPVGGGAEVWWEEKDGKKRIQPGDIEMTSVAGHVANGQIWIIKQVRNYAT